MWDIFQHLLHWWNQTSGSSLCVCYAFVRYFTSLKCVTEKETVQLAHLYFSGEGDWITWRFCCVSSTECEGWERSLLPHLAVCFTGTLYLPKMTVQNSIFLPSQRPVLNSAASVKITARSIISVLGQGGGWWGQSSEASGLPQQCNWYFRLC